MKAGRRGILAAGLAAVAAIAGSVAAEERVDASSLTGKVMCGYQGWFSAEGDGSVRPWQHYGKGRKFEPGSCTIDLWPDMTEYGESERFATSFRHADGSTAFVFSSLNAKTVERHFGWMEEHGIDGAFVQRFVSGLKNETSRAEKDRVLANCRSGAAKHGRAWAVMYDLSGLKAGEVERCAEDWRRLSEAEKVTEAKGYLHHRGKPLVAVWGVGFGDDRAYSLEECGGLVAALKGSGCAVLLGVPTGWRTLNRDSVRDRALHTLLAKVDVISPWTVGRYNTPADVARHGERDWKSDIDWCAAKAVDYMPVVFPGFSWSNLEEGAPLDQIPRLKGRFLWSQFMAAKAARASMIYVAMFDEIDEGTAIFKCTNDPPAGASSFLTYEGLPEDYYLRLTGLGGKLLRGEIPVPADGGIPAEAEGGQ